MLAREIIAGPLVRAACERHLTDLESGDERGLKWDREKAERALRFFPAVLRLADGQHAGQPFTLSAFEEFIVGSLFGWTHADTGFRRFISAYIEIGKGNGKALSLDTPIPTPSGWSTMGALKIGDHVFDESGRACRVVAATEPMSDRPCFRVKFSDGAEIVADAGHQWLTSALRTGGRKGPKPASEPRKGGYALRTTAQIARSLRTSRSWNHRVDLAGALALSDVELPVPPYTLGAWLGDGDSDSARLTMAFADEEIAEAIRGEGVTVEANRPQSANIGRYLLGRGTLKNDLRSLALLHDKHIPPIYLRAGTRQRIELLRGLMDSDGYCATSGQCEFTTTKARLASDVTELLRSLGFKICTSTGRATIAGRDCGPKWRLLFTAPSTLPVFRLGRKARRQKTSPTTRPLSAGRMVIGCEAIDSVPVRCIRVDSANGLFLAGEHMVPTHNSPLAAGIGLYMMIADGEMRAEVYAAATTRDQAHILFEDAVSMRDQSPHLTANVERSGKRKPINLAHLRSGSFFRPISAEGRSLDGKRVHCALIDEVHEHPNGQVIEKIKAGTKGRRQPLIVEITNSGFDRTSICYRHREYSERIVNGVVADDTWFAYVCAKDDGDDPMNDPSVWIKTNPNLGVSIGMQYLEQRVREAKGMPAAESLVRRLNFCEWVDAENPWISGTIWRRAERKIEWESLRGRRAFAAIDLSGTNDLTAAALAFPPDAANPKWAAWVHFWTPSDTLAERSRRDMVPYDQWVRDGLMTATPGRNVEYSFVAQWVADMQVEVRLQSLAFDPYRIKYLETELDEINIAIDLVPHGQGFFRSAESSLWMPRSIEELEALLNREEIEIATNEVLRWNSASAVLVNDPKDNKIFTKRKSKGRIDGLQALAMAVGLARRKLDKTHVMPPGYSLLIV